MELAGDRDAWKLRVRAIKDTVNIYAGREEKRKRKKEKVGEQTGKKRRVLIGTGIDAVEVTVGSSGEEGGEETTEESEEDDDDKDKGKAEVIGKKRKPTRGRVRCKDGFAMSVQASRYHACTPRDDKGPYSAVEVGYPNQWEPLLLPFSNDPNPKSGYAPIIYQNVPAKTLREVVERHEGLRRDSARLPELIETDESGYQWAAAAEIPPSIDEASAEGDPEAGSPSSAINMGAPPPPPPPISQLTPTINATARTGALTPPTTMQDITISPIAAAAATAHDESNCMQMPMTESPKGAEEMNDLGEAVLYVRAVEFEEDEEYEAGLESKIFEC